MEGDEESPYLFFRFQCSVDESSDVELFSVVESFDEAEDLSWFPVLPAGVVEALGLQEVIQII